MPKPIEIDIEKLHVRNFQHWTYISTVQVSIFYVQENLRTRASKSGTPVSKSRYFTVVGQSFVKTVADRHGHIYHNKYYSDELFHRINTDNFERP